MGKNEIKFAAERVQDDLKTQILALKEIDSLIDDRVDPDAIAIKLRRWRDTVSEIIKTKISSREQVKFINFWINCENESSSWPLVIERLTIFLNELVNQIDQHPELVIQAPMLKKQTSTNKNPWGSLKEHPIAIILFVIIATVGITWKIFETVIQQPLEREIAQLKEQREFTDSARASLKMDSPLFTYQLLPGTDLDKKYLSKSPSQLVSGVETMTPEESKRFIESEYVDRWIVFKAPIFSVYASDDLGTLDFDNGIVKTRVSMESGEVEKLKKLYKGKEVTIQAKFNLIMDGYISFVDGKVISP